MASQKMIAVALVLSAAAMVQADNCAKVDASYQLKTSTATTYCDSASMSCSKEDGCDCAATCCERKPNTCGAVPTITCGADEYEDDLKSASAVKADKTDAPTQCCTKKKMCDIACPANYKDKTGKATIKCSSGTCSTFECCDAVAVVPDATTCAGTMAAAAAADKYCVTATEYMDNSKAAVKATADTFKANCCTAKKVCDVTCPNTHKDKTDKVTIKCAAAVCKATECCDPDTTKCANHPLAAGKGCDATKEYVDSSKVGNVAKADSSDYKTQCCSAKATCAAFKDHVLEGQASGAEKQQVSVTALLAVAAGVLALAK